LGSGGTDILSLFYGQAIVPRSFRVRGQTDAENKQRSGVSLQWFVGLSQLVWYGVANGIALITQRTVHSFLIDQLGSDLGPL
jgi:hypothetical protein